jgi:hypothetical protein
MQELLCKEKWLFHSLGPTWLSVSSEGKRRKLKVTLGQPVTASGWPRGSSQPLPNWSAQRAGKARAMVVGALEMTVAWLISLCWWWGVVLRPSRRRGGWDEPILGSMSTGLTERSQRRRWLEQRMRWWCEVAPVVKVRWAGFHELCLAELNLLRLLTAAGNGVLIQVTLDEVRRGNGWGLGHGGTHGPRLPSKGMERWRGGGWSMSGLSWHPFWHQEEH